MARHSIYSLNSRSIAHSYRRFAAGYAGVAVGIFVALTDCKRP